MAAKHRYLLALIIASVVMVLTAGVVSASKDDRYTALRSAVGKHDPFAALTEITAIEADGTKANQSTTAYPLNYLRGLLATEISDLAAVFSAFKASENDNENEIAAAAIGRQAAFARATGNLLFERILLTDLGTRFPETRTARDARFRLAENAYDAGDGIVTRELLTRKTGQNASDKKFTDRAKLLFANACLRSGDTAASKPVFADLAKLIKPDERSPDAAIAAVRSLDLIGVGSDEFGRSVPDLSASEHLVRGWSYLQERDIANAKLHYDAVIAIDPWSADAADVTLRLGRGYAQIGEHSEALKWYERLIERYPDSALLKDALLLSASAYGRLGRPKEAINRYESFIERYPTDEKLDRAYLNIVDINRDLGEDQEALKWCERTRQRFGNGPVAAVATFAMSRIRIARSEWNEAIVLLDELAGYKDLGGTSFPGGTTSAEVRFLKAYSLEMSRRYGEAIDSYLTFTPKLGDYFAERAAERIAMLSSNETAMAEIAQRTAGSAGQISGNTDDKDATARATAAKKLLLLTRDSDLRQRSIEVLRTAKGVATTRVSGRTEQLFRDRPTGAASRFRSIGAFADAVAIDGAKPPSDIVSAEIAAASDRGDLAMAYGTESIKKLADMPFDAIDRDILRVAYPVPFRASILRHAAAQGVDPRLMLAIMRQESAFKPDARSSVSARGLMQFMTPTAIRSAKTLAIDTPSIDHLYEPEMSILLGSVYLTELFALFPNMPEAVAASYNGGEDNMKRWLARSRSNESERGVPEIMFTQTKDYVYRVMGNYQVYRRLYDENLRHVN